MSMLAGDCQSAMSQGNDLQANTISIRMVYQLVYLNPSNTTYKSMRTSQPRARRGDVPCVGVAPIQKMQQLLFGH